MLNDNIVKQSQSKPLSIANEDNHSPSILPYLNPLPLYKEKADKSQPIQFKAGGFKVLCGMYCNFDNSYKSYDGKLMDEVVTKCGSRDNALKELDRSL